MRINREAVVAAVLLLFCGVLFAATFAIRQTSYATIGSELWPRIVVIVLAGFTAVHLIGALRRRRSAGDGEAPPQSDGARRESASHRNPILCFAVFAVFLLTLPYLGMLLGGVLFVFATLTLLGDRDPRSLLLHAAIALGTVGAMWAVFTFALRVILPEGELLRFW